MVFEILGVNLLEVIKRYDYKGVRLCVCVGVIGNKVFYKSITFFFSYPKNKEDEAHD